MSRNHAQASYQDTLGGAVENLLMVLSRYFHFDPQKTNASKKKVFGHEIMHYDKRFHGAIRLVEMNIKEANMDLSLPKVQRDLIALPAEDRKAALSTYLQKLNTIFFP
ncbi:MAG: hypothetical protein A2846_04815 [Candidatus Doudnabacteria bacterium RIFCSPHIGHO2_01_FULL_49_9]|uniref:Uncharacterized protein n=1 Tax=Candidatus Doudnabacteria bacterium RIFCSPHIGHO2_01_FULL_49_9 TaxID=1817827 RepID=A0A1F5P3P2_9BACT|nr:MAG: hypothetical protein A2846_04815 [Candidatus Doudnabacteria bacterium RIFCSPHIGHO2_01_FULL_49_9]